MACNNFRIRGKADARCATSRTDDKTARHAMRLPCSFRMQISGKWCRSSSFPVARPPPANSAPKPIVRNIRVASPTVFMGRHFKMQANNERERANDARASKKHNLFWKGSTFLWVYKSSVFDLFMLKSISLRICSVHWQFNDIFQRCNSRNKDPEKYQRTGRHVFIIYT